MLKPLEGKGYKLRDWLTSYPFLIVAIDPYTYESSWILETSIRIFEHFNPADIRVGWLCTADEQGCQEFLGPLAESYLTFPDPARLAVSALGVDHLPSLVHIRADGFVQTAQGWDPKTWTEVCDRAAKILAWNNTLLGTQGDPGPFPGTPAQV